MEESLTKFLRVLVGLLCSYEALALATRKTPTICTISRDKKWIAPIILSGLALHMYAPVKSTVILVDNIVI